MKLKLKNIDIARVVSFLERENFKGLKSVNRSKVTNFLGEKINEIVEGEKTIREDYKDDKDKREKELRDYFHQTVTVEGANYLAGLKIIESRVKEVTAEDSEKEFSGDDAYALSVLYEALNVGGGTDESND